MSFLSSIILLTVKDPKTYPMIVLNEIFLIALAKITVERGFLQLKNDQC